MQAGKQGIQPIVAFCSVLIPSRGIRRDILVYDRPKQQHLARQLIETAKLVASSDRDLFGALQAALSALIEEQPNNDLGIEGAALALFMHTGDHYFMIQCHHRNGGLATDYDRLKATNPDDAKREVDAKPISTILSFMELTREMHGLPA